MHPFTIRSGPFAAVASATTAGWAESHDRQRWEFREGPETFEAKHGGLDFAAARVWGAHADVWTERRGGRGVWEARDPARQRELDAFILEQWTVFRGFLTDQIALADEGFRLLAPPPVSPVPTTAQGDLRAIVLQRLPSLPRLTAWGIVPAETCCLYLFAKRDMLKIGISSQPWLRARTLGFECGENVSVVCALPLESRDVALAFERVAHAEFHAHRLLGEWFRDVPEIRAWFGVEP